MYSPRTTTITLVLVGTLLLASFSLPVNLHRVGQQQPPPGWLDTLLQQTEVHQQVHAPQTLFIHTDRTLYGPGGMIWGSVYLANAVDHSLTDNGSRLSVSLINARGDAISEQTVSIRNGRSRIALSIPASQPGGRYQLFAQLLGTTEVSFSKEITVQPTVYPNLRMKLEMERESYRAGETAKAFVELQNLENLPLSRHRYEWTFEHGGTQLASGESMTNLKGLDTLEIRIPSEAEPPLILNLRIPYRGNAEGISRPVNLQVEKLNLHFFPEGGELIAAVENQIAFKALDWRGEAQDISGVIKAETGKVVARFESLHQGMGVCSFTPVEGMAYFAEVKGSDIQYPLPKAINAPLHLHLDRQQGNQLLFQVNADVAQTAFLVGRTRGRVYEALELDVSAGANDIQVPTERFPSGVASFTLFDRSGTPRAERRGFLHQDRQLDIELSLNKESYEPGDEVKVGISVRDETGEPCAATLSMAVVDDRNLTFADDKQPHLMAHLLLNSELEGEIEEPNFYFDPAEADATKALDLLMLTHGWKRYHWEEVRATPLDQRQSDGSTALNLRGVVKLRGTDKVVPEAKVTLFQVESDWQTSSTVTDELGRFSFQLPASGVINLYIEGKGVKDQELDVQLDRESFERLGAHQVPNWNWYWYGNRDQSHQIRLVEPAVEIASTGATSSNSMVASVTTVQNLSAASLDEVVVVGYGQQLAGQVSGVVVRQAAGYAYPASSLPDYLGRPHNLTVTASSGEWGAPRVPMIRGLGSVGGQMPLILLDGVLTSPAELAGLNARQIQTITVQPEGELAATYGNQAAYGVINITTRDWVGHSSWRPPRKRGHLLTFNLIPAAEYVPETFSAFYRSHPSQDRDDRRITMHWEDDIQVPETGKSDISFHTYQEATTYLITVMGMGTNGLSGVSEQAFATIAPLSMQVKVPTSLQTYDRLLLPVTLTNQTNRKLEVPIHVSGHEHFLAVDSSQFVPTIELSPNEGRTLFIPFVTTGQIGMANVTISAGKGGLVTNHTFQLPISSRGFPFTYSFSASDTLLETSVDLGQIVQESAQLRLRIYPNIIQSLIDARNSMIRMPHGCFEQTSSSAFPNILALHLIRSVGYHDPKFEAQAMAYIKAGHDRLKTFETPTHGFSYWGRPPASLYLSAKGLLEFWWMSQHYPDTDQKLIERTREYLLGQRDGKGSYYSSPTRRLGNGNSAPTQSAAYVTYALAQTGRSNLDKELDYLYEQCADSGTSTYVLALSTRALFAAGDSSRGRELVRKLMSRVDTSHQWKPHGRSLTGAYGYALSVETNSLSILAALESGMVPLDQLVEPLTRLHELRRGGMFGSTQATVWAMEAFAAYQQALSNDRHRSGQVSIFVNDSLIHQINFSTNQVNQPSFFDFPLTDGRHDIRIVQEVNGDPIPFSVDVQGHSRVPSSNPECRLRLRTSLNKEVLKPGEAVSMQVAVQNIHPEAVTNPMVQVGIPPGLGLQPWHLQKMQEQGQFAYYEIQSGELWLYFESFEAAEERTLSFDLLATVPGRYEGSASSAYLYYNNQHKDWQPGLRVNILSE